MSSFVVNKMLSLCLASGLVLSTFNSGALAVEEGVVAEGPVPASTIPTNAEILAGDDVAVYLAPWPGDEDYDFVAPQLECNQNPDIDSLIPYNNASMHL